MSESKSLFRKVSTEDCSYKALSNGDGPWVYEHEPEYDIDITICGSQDEVIHEDEAAADSNNVHIHYYDEGKEPHEIYQENLSPEEALSIGESLVEVFLREGLTGLLQEAYSQKFLED